MTSRTHSGRHQHREPDRVPIDCGAMRSTGIQAIAYNRLKATWASTAATPASST